MKSQGGEVYRDAVSWGPQDRTPKLRGSHVIARALQRANQKLMPTRLLYPPQWLVLGVNNLCNLHCKMCDVGTAYEESNFYQHLTGARPLNMPLNLLRSVMGQAAHHYPQVKIGYAFTEPSIYPHLIESLQYAQGLGLFTSMTSNGLNLKKIAEGLAQAGLNELYISLDGPPAIHNEIRGHKRSFERAMAGIAALKEADPTGRVKVEVFCTLTQWNVPHLFDFADLFRGTQVARIGFMHTNFTPNAVVAAHNRQYGTRYPATLSNMEGITVDAMDLDLLEAQIHRLRATDWPFDISFSPDLKTRDALSTFYQHPERLIGSVCNDAFRAVMIKSNGDVIPAHGRCYDVVAGNLYDTPLTGIWNGAPLAEFRKTLIKAGGLLPACSRCCSAF